MIDAAQPPGPRNGWLLVLAALACALAGGVGCGTTKPDLRRTLTFESTPLTNEGKPFYVVVRVVGDGDFLAETYRKAAERVVPGPDDPSLRATIFAQPGKSETVVIEAQDDEALGIFALFTSPGEPWKLLVNPKLVKKYVFDLGAQTLSLRGPEAPKTFSDRSSK